EQSKSVVANTATTHDLLRSRECRRVLFRANLTNGGTVEVQSGTLSLAGGGSSAGHFTLGAGAELDLVSYGLGDGTAISGPGFAQIGRASCRGRAGSSAGAEPVERGRRNRRG